MFDNFRVQANILGGLEVEEESETKRRKWSWWDPKQHVHAPPFQPIFISFNSSVSVKLHSQNKMYLSFTAEGEQFNFRVGPKLKVGKEWLFSSITYEVLNAF